MQLKSRPVNQSLNQPPEFLSKTSIIATCALTKENPILNSSKLFSDPIRQFSIAGVEFNSALILTTQKI